MDAIPVEIDRKDLIEGLGKGLRVIEAFDEEHASLTPSEVAAAAGITRTAARRYLLTLCHFGYAATDGRHFWLMPRVLRLGHSYLSAARLPRLVQPFIQRASAVTGETCNVSVLDGHEVVYVARSSSPRLVSIGFNAGARAPAHTVAPGIIILSTWPDEAVQQWVAEHQFSRFTPYTVTDPGLFLELVRSARAAGYWVSDQQLDLGLRGLAVPLKDRKGECKGAIGSTLQIHAQTVGQVVERMLPTLQEAAQALRDLV